jgi:hypothetical protein
VMRSINLLGFEHDNEHRGECPTSKTRPLCLIAFGLVTAVEQFPKQSVSFPLSTPSIEDPNLFPKFLKIAANLNGLGTQFQNIRFDEAIVDVPLTPRPLQLVFTSGSQLIRLEFLLNEQNPF